VSGKYAPHDEGALSRESQKSGVGELGVNVSSTFSRVGKAAKVGGAVVAAAVVVAVPTFAATVAAQADDTEVSPAIRDAVVSSGFAQVGGGPVGGVLAAGIPVPGGPPQAVAPGAPGAPTATTAVASAAPLPAAKKVVSQKELLRLVKKNFPQDQIGNAMAVAQCESGQRSIVGDTNPDGTADWGVFQLNDAGTLQGSLRTIGVSFADTRAAQVAALNPVINVKAAGAIYRDRGWAPWVCAYKQQIVASLYSNDRGPMYGRYNAVGGSLGSLKPSDADLAKMKAKEKAKAKAKQKEKEQAAKDKAKPSTPAKKPPVTSGPKPDPTPDPTPTPTPTDSATAEQSTTP
jgi:hypothetical protein